MMSGSGFDLVLDELYTSGWTALDSSDCETHDDGRLFPGMPRVEQEMKDLGFELSLKHIQLFDCFRAEWSDAASRAPIGAVVGSSELEAAVYALAQVRMQLRVGVNP